MRRKILSILIGVSACLIAVTSSLASDDGVRIIAIGDLHGDFDAYQALMIEAGLINKRGRWTGGDSILVQTGDVPDRGPNSRKIIESLQKLQKRAARKGGKVVTLIGNHEAMNMTGDLRYVHPGEYAAFTDRNSETLRDKVFEANRESIEASYRERDDTLTPEQIRALWYEATPLGMIEHQQAWRPGGEIGDWVLGNDAVAVIGDSLFAHGGISEKYASFTLDEINNEVGEALASQSLAPSSIINDPDGPLWYRGNVVRQKPLPVAAGENELPAAHELPEPAVPRLSQEDEIDLVLERFGVSRLIVGHTPALDGITVFFGGKLIQIDTGVSGYYGGSKSFLRIEDGRLYAHNNGEITLIGENAE